ncbi:hypothetical protein LTS02_016715 [Friedmanniomyces endolithicus]|nr:hypothetical protein LTS02_016715 [Friedmanniomyces endolithicus]
MAPIELQSNDHRNLLDIVDKLRLTGITRYIDLPQIVVCGDQSAGKSSVLEAISGIRFPTKDNLCTRFATELVLRRDENAGVKVSIIPGSNRDDHEKQRLSEFSHEVDMNSPDIGGLIEEAKQVMGLSQTKVFSSDVLRVEFQGVNQPHLTLVDLPGLFRAGSREQSEHEAPIVHQMVRGYMEQPRSIILAVVSAKSDFALQEVTKYARELDPDGMRTLGLITKPDTLSKDSDSEVAYIAMAQNKDVVFRLGWHVLRNRSFETRDVSAEARDVEETRFFESGAWASLNPSTVGIRSLKPRLSNTLRDQILQHLPSLHSDVLSGIQDCELRLKQLGEARSTPYEQRRHLQRVSWKFSVLMKASVDGVYSDAFFGHAKTEEGRRKRLRAVVQNGLEDFAEDVRIKGHAQAITEDDGEHDSGSKQVSTITRTAYVASVKELMRHNRGIELSGTFNPSIIGELFREQCQPWREIVANVQNSILQSTRWTARAIVEEVAVSDTVDAIFALVDRAIENLGRNVNTKVEELLRPYLAGHPITYNHYLISNVQHIQADRQRRALKEKIQNEFNPSRAAFGLNDADLSRLINIVVEREEADMGDYASQLAVDYMQAYYKVAMKNCVDDVSIHAIEEQLVRNLPPVFNSDVLEKLDDAQVANLVAEKQSSAIDRAHNEEKLSNLVKASQELQRLDRHLLQLHVIESHEAIPDINEQSEPQKTGLHTDGHLDHLPSNLSVGVSTGVDAVTSPPSSAVEAEVDVGYPAQAMRKKLKKGRQSGGAYSYD